MKLLKMLLPVIILALSLSGCATKRTDISLEEIIEAYEEAGYSVWSRECDEPSDYGAIAYIQADHPDGGYIYFTIFETSQQAKAYKKEFYHPGMMGLFSVIFGDPTWPIWKVYGSIVAEYDHDNSYFIAPFNQLRHSS